MGSGEEVAGTTVGEGGIGVGSGVEVENCRVFSAMASALRMTSSLDLVGSSVTAAFEEQLTKVRTIINGQ